MREILFRGKMDRSGMWVQGDLRQYPSGAVAIRSELIGNTVKVIPATVGQYTGLKDKNGLRIFEGDIVDHYYQKGFSNRGVVVWQAENARFTHELRTMSPAFVFFNPEAWEVIGNIHDNPELIERSEST